jgi:hypothetical protein
MNDAARETSGESQKPYPQIGKLSREELDFISELIVISGI